VKKEEIENRLEELGEWYHPVDLGNGIKVPVVDERQTRPHWERNRQVREQVDYRDKLVLDLGCAEGMWSFEAEKLGARRVIAIDIGQEEYQDRAMFAKEALKSSVLFYLNVPVEDLHNRLDHFFSYHSQGEKFDIVQHLGLFYHLRDPLRSLCQVRRCIKKGGDLLFETTLYLAESKEPVALFNLNSRIYHDGSVWWAPNLKCLFAMLRYSLFEPTPFYKIAEDSRKINIGRISLVAKAVGIETVSSEIALVLRQGVHLGLEADV